MVYVAGVVLATILLTPLLTPMLVAIIQRKEPLMNEQHTDGTAAPPQDTAAGKVEDVLRKQTGGTEEHPIEGHADEAQREPQAGLGNDTQPDRQEHVASDHTTPA